MVQYDVVYTYGMVIYCVMWYGVPLCDVVYSISHIIVNVA